MRLSIPRLAGMRDITIRNWKKAWQTQGKFYEVPRNIPQALLDRGVDVIDVDKVHQELPRWSPPVPDDPRFAARLAPEERDDWREEPAFRFHDRTRLFEGMKQACLLAKAQHLEGLPPGVERLVGKVTVPDRDLLLQRYIMQAQVWDTSEDRLPKSFDPSKPRWRWIRRHGIPSEKSSVILLRNLLRLCQNQAGKFPSLLARKQIPTAWLHSYVDYRGSSLVTSQNLTFLVTSDRWLEPFADESVLDASVAHKLPDMWPVFPTVDLAKTNNYQLCDTVGLKRIHPLAVPHTMIQVPKVNWWADTCKQASQVIACLFATAAIARRKFGDDVRLLPEPVSIQHILLQEDRISNVCFQLNTLDLDSDSGVKNLVWTGGMDFLFEKILGRPWMSRRFKDSGYVNFDPTVFDKFLAMYLNGTSELTGE